MSSDLTKAWIDTLMHHDDTAVAAVVFGAGGECAIGARHDVMAKPQMVAALRGAADELERSMIRGDLDPEPGGWNHVDPGGDGS